MSNGLIESHWVTDKATVISVEPDGSALWVSADKKSACASCRAKSGCGTAVLAKLTSNQIAVRALISADLAGQIFVEGQEVDICVDKNALVKVALMMYLVPLLGLMLGVIAGLGQHEGVVFLLGLMGLALGGLLASRMLKVGRNDIRLQPLVLRRSLEAGHSEIDVR